MGDRRQSFPMAMKGTCNESKVPEDVVQRQQTFTVGTNKSYRNQSGDYASFARLWHDRMVNRKTPILREFKAKETFKKAIGKVRSLLKVTNAFQSCLGDSTSPEKQNTFQYYADILDVKGNCEEEKCTADDEGNSSKPLFDPAWFKANREIRLGSETKTILNQEPSSRTPEQIQTVFRYLYTLPSFAEYPLYHQKAICQDATYQSFPANVTILRQGYRADNFYFVLSGSATVVTNRESVDEPKDNRNNPESVSVVKRGMAFGEAAIMNNSLRNVTVVSKTHIELLVVSKEDYAKIFFGKDSESGEKEYITFLRTVDFLRDWPVDILKSNPEQSQHCYFRRGAVIVQNSNNSHWLYVVKSGVCEVLIRLNAVKPRKSVGKKPQQFKSCLEELTRLTLERRRDLKTAKDPMKMIEQNNSNERIRFRRQTLCHVPEMDLINGQRYSKEVSDNRKLINSITEEEFVSEFVYDVNKTTDSKINPRSSSAIYKTSEKLPKLSKPNTCPAFNRRRKSTVLSYTTSDDFNFLSRRPRSHSMPTTVSGDLEKICRKKCAFVQIDLLHPKRVFGLSELDFEYNALNPGRPASVSLVSRGAECIMISKRFFMEHANAFTKSWIRLNVQPYLPLERHQETLQEKVDWETFKTRIVNSVVC